MAGAQNLQVIRDIFTRLAAPASRVARFSYTDEAYRQRQIEGSAQYDYHKDQNIPLMTMTDTNTKVLDKGIRSQGASISRNFQNHFTGRVSFNLNLVVDMLGMFIDWVASIMPMNVNLYDPTLLYLPGDTAFLLTNTIGGQVVYTAYIRNSNSPQGAMAKPPTDLNYWIPIREHTSLARRIPDAQGVDMNTYLETGAYWFLPAGSPLQIKNFPGIPKTDSGAATVRVWGDIENKVTTTQEVTFRDTGIQYIRTLSGTTEVTPWYRAGDPKGLEIVGVPGLWAFRLGCDPNNIAGDNMYGNLYLYFDDTNVPRVTIERDPADPLWGHMIWEYSPLPPAPPPGPSPIPPQGITP